MKQNKKILILSSTMLSAMPLIALANSCNNDSLDLESIFKNQKLSIDNLAESDYPNTLPSSINKNKVKLSYQSNDVIWTIIDWMSNDSKGEITFKVLLANKNNSNNKLEKTFTLGGFKKSNNPSPITEKLGQEHHQELLSRYSFDKKLLASMNKNVSFENDANFTITSSKLVLVNDNEGKIKLAVAGSYKGKEFKETEIETTGFLKKFDAFKSLSAEINYNALFENKKKFEDIKELKDKQLLSYLSVLKGYTSSDNDELDFVKLLSNDSFTIKKLEIKNDKGKFKVDLAFEYKYENEGQVLTQNVSKVTSSEIEKTTFDLKDYFKFLETKIEVTPPSKDEYASFYSAKWNDLKVSLLGHFLKIHDDYKNYEGDQVIIDAIQIRANDITGELFYQYKFKIDQSGKRTESINQPIGTLKGFKKISEDDNYSYKKFGFVGKGSTNQNWKSLIDKVEKKYNDDKGEQQINYSIDGAEANQVYFGLFGSKTDLIKKGFSNGQAEYKITDMTSKAWNFVNSGVEVNETNGFDLKTGVYHNKYQISNLWVKGSKIDNFQKINGKIQFTFHFEFTILINNSSNETGESFESITFEYKYDVK